MATADDDADLGPLLAAYAAQVESTSRHPVSPTTVERVREVLTDAFTTAATTLAEGSTPDDTTTTGRVDLPPADPREPGSAGVETSTTRTSASEHGQVVLAETTSRRGDAVLRTTIALTGSSAEGERFWLGATSYADAPVDHVELVGDLPAYAAPVLGDVLTALRRGPQG